MHRQIFRGFFVFFTRLPGLQFNAISQLKKTTSGRSLNFSLSIPGPKTLLFFLDITKQREKTERTQKNNERTIITYCEQIATPSLDLLSHNKLGIFLVELTVPIAMLITMHLRQTPTCQY